MTFAELQARAIQRAHDERVHIFRVPGRPGVYRTRSKSNPYRRHTLVARDGVEACSCRGFEYRKNCKHVEALRNRLAREAGRSGGPLDDESTLLSPYEGRLLRDAGEQPLAAAC
jgi:hypothetical protein